MCSSGTEFRVTSRGCPSIDLGVRWLRGGLWYDRLWSSGSFRRRMSETCLLSNRGSGHRAEVGGCAVDSGLVDRARAGNGDLRIVTLSLFVPLIGETYPGMP